MTRAADGPDRFDRELRARGFGILVGVDEVGRGCLAGPVVAAAVVLPADAVLPGVLDSKALTPAARAREVDGIRAVALSVAFAFVGPRTIDRLNIRQASLLAMRRAVRRCLLRLRPAVGGDAADPARRVLVVVDGDSPIPDLAFAQEATVGGDRRSRTTAAASIVAKTVRDRFMNALESEDDRFGFARHKGYGTSDHLLALERHGPCRWHRFSFAPVRQPSLFALAPVPAPAPAEPIHGVESESPEGRRR